jgi:hypothetical protein
MSRAGATSAASAEAEGRIRNADRKRRRIDELLSRI